MHNPSLADGWHDDPTVRRCSRLAREWGYASMQVVNLFAYRTSCPDDLWAAVDPVGPDNDRFILRALASADTIVLAWGDLGDPIERAGWLLDMLTEARCVWTLGLTKAGHPRHPLYVPRNTRPVPVNIDVDGRPWLPATTRTGRSDATGPP